MTGCGSAETVEAYVAHVRENDPVAALSLLHPEGTVRQAASLPWGGTWTGPSGASKMVDRINEVAELEPHGEEVHRAGHRVVVRSDTSFTFASSGKQLRLPVLEVHTVEDGSIRDIDVYYKSTQPIVDECGETVPASRLLIPAPPGDDQPVEPTSSTDITPAMHVMYTFFQEFNSGDLAGVASLVAETGTFHEAAELPWGGDWTGPAGFGDLLGKMLSLAGLTINTAAIEDAGEFVMVQMDAAFTNASTGLRAPMPMVELYTIVDGKITDADIYYKDVWLTNAVISGG